MALRDTTNQKFKDFFVKAFKMSEGQEFEFAFSEIQRETGAANVTMKRAIESLVNEGWLVVKPGRNSRYGRFLIVAKEIVGLIPEKVIPPASVIEEKPSQTTPQENADRVSLTTQVSELESVVENLRRRLRTQEMTIALLQDRLAEIEDKLLKK